MAIFFTHKDTLSRFVPKNKKYFESPELIEIMGTQNISPIKVGPVWVIYDEDKFNYKSQGNYNLIGSEYFRQDLWGDLLIVPSTELPVEWNIVEESEKEWQPDLIDASFLKLIDDFCRTAGVTLEWIGEIDGIISDQKETLLDNNKEEIGETNKTKKEKFNYFPKKQNPETRETPDFKKFLENTIPFVLKYEHEPNKHMLIFADEQVEINVISEDDKKDTLEQIIQFCLETERYEEIPELQKIYDTLK